MNRRRRVRVPASSANLGPGFDVLAAALSAHLELEVEETGSFSLETDVDGVPTDRTNLVVRAFERLAPADGLSFRVNSRIPGCGGLGSSAAAIVAGLVAADHLFELDADVLEEAVALEGHPDNVSASLLGGIVVCPPGERPVRFEAPDALEALVVTPHEVVRTDVARAALPPSVPIADAVANVAWASLLVAGLRCGDLDWVARGLRDRLHEPRRAAMYPRSRALADEAASLGALGATISGSGPSVLVWCRVDATGAVAGRLRERCDGWAEVVRLPFAAQGADVVAL